MICKLLILQMYVPTPLELIWQKIMSFSFCNQERSGLGCQNENEHTRTGRAVGAAEAGGISPPDFGRSVNPISTRGSRLYPPLNYSPLPLQIFKPSYGPADASERLH